MHRAIRLLVLAGFGLLLTSGCDKGTPCYEVSGTVAFDRAPVERGEISFVPDEPELAPDAGLIENGRFRFQATAGKRTVRIRASRKLPPERQDSPQMGPLYEDYIPARFNSQSVLKVEVSSEGNNTFTFDLTSK